MYTRGKLVKIASCYFCIEIGRDCRDLAHDTCVEIGQDCWVLFKIFVWKLVMIIAILLRILAWLNILVKINCNVFNLAPYSKILGIVVTILAWNLDQDY